MSDFGWIVLENIIIVIVAGILAYTVSAWCLLILLICNNFKKELK